VSRNFQKKIQFVCFDCSKKLWVKRPLFEDFYDFFPEKRDEPPFIICFQCFDGVAYPLNFINPFGYHFKTEKGDLCPDCHNHYQWKILKRRPPEPFFSNS
jgi:hypothetical protein